MAQAAGAVAGLAGGILGGSGGQASQTVQESRSAPVIIPRQPPVLPQITTGQGSSINVAGLFGLGQPTSGEAVLDQTKPQQEIGEVNPAAGTLLGLDIGVDIDPKIAERRGQLDQSIQGITGQVQGSIAEIQQQVQNINNLDLPDIDTAQFDEIAEIGEQQRSQLLGIDQQLGNQIGALENMYRQLGENSNAFVEARTRGLMEGREKARRDASRRGISGPLAALATNPIDTQIADERSKAAQDVQDAQLRIRQEQRALQQTRLQVQQQFDQVRQRNLQATSEKFRQADERFSAGVGQATSVASLEQLVQGGASILRTLAGDQSGLNQQAFAQEITELGLGNEIFQMIVNSQLVTPTAQMSESFSRSETEGGGDRWGDLWSHLKDFTQEGLLKGGGFLEPTLAHGKFTFGGD